MIPHALVSRRAAPLLLLLGLAAAVPMLAHTAWPGGGAVPADAGGARAVEARRAVVLAVQRDQRLHVFDAGTLEPLGSFRMHNLAESVEARPDGGMLFLRQADTPTGNGCCALYVLDLGTREMCRLIAPAIQPVPLTGNGRVFSQRGNVGIEVFDSFTLERLPTIAAPGVYDLLPSADGRWLLGVNRFRGTSVDLVDALSGTLVRRLPVRLPDGDGNGHEPAGWVTGAWLDDRFILYAADGGAAYLWTMTPDTEELGPPTPVTMAPGLTGAGIRHVFPMLVPSDGRLLLHDARAWWFKVGGEPGAPGAGLYVLDPLRAVVTAQLTGDVEVAQVVARSDGRLFGLDAGDPQQGRPVRLLALDAETGAVLAERSLADDVWHITAATIPEDLLPRGEAEPAACSRPEPPPLPATSTPAVAPGQ